ncbi:unnamed protein product [Dibothriocephalus latus]|uniref:Uncharacterized protein n=1 Tax=Dibothriocephalus latus TaxID=60516 RepID=A0A3P6U3Y0_DIBLA|nr:unnamed protein product [Dibothriocephalus latus]
MAKLFSEIGGLCSLFIGFSCIFIFELLEAMLLFRSDKRELRVVAGETEQSPAYCCADEAAAAVTRNGGRRKKRSPMSMEKNSLHSAAAKSETVDRQVKTVSNEADKETTKQERTETVMITVMMRTSPSLERKPTAVSENEVTRWAADNLALADSQGKFWTIYLILIHGVRVDYIVKEKTDLLLKAIAYDSAF